jgi:hypothetical protein
VHTGRSQILEVQVLDDRNARAHQQQDVAWQSHTELGVGGTDDVPRHVVGADRTHFLLDQPARAGGADARSTQVISRLRPELSEARSHEHDIPRTNRNMGGGLRTLQLFDRNGVIGRKALRPRNVEQDAASHERRHGFDAEDAKAGRGLNRAVDMHATMQGQVFSLVRQRIDVGARMFWHDDKA